MTRTDAWSEVIITAGTARTFTVPRAIPAGRLIAVALGRGGAGVVTSVSTLGGNAWTIEGAGPHTNNTMNVALLTCRVTTAISAGATFTVTASATSNRWALAAAVFDDVLTPIHKAVMASPFSDATPRMDVGPTPSLTAPRALVLTAAAFTSNGAPIDNQGNAVDAQTVTAVGSADRGCALLHKYEGGYAHTGSYYVSNSSTSVGITAAFESSDLPAGTIPYMTDEGEVPGHLSVWTGGVERPVVGLELAPVPTIVVPKTMIGMSAPSGLWNTRLSEVGAEHITCRRIFADMTSSGTDQATLIERAISDGMMPVVSYKEPSPGGVADVNGVIAGTYDSWINNIKAYLTSLDTEIITIFHHEARGDMTQSQFLAASRRWLDMVQTDKLKVTPINMGFLLDTVNGRNEFNTWSNASLLADWDYFGIDTYHSGTFDSPGPKRPGDRIPPLLTWLAAQGQPTKPVIIGEYNGWTADAVAHAGEMFLSTENIKIAMVFNSDSGSKGEPLTGDRLTAFVNTKADSRALATYTP